MSKFLSIFIQKTSGFQLAKYTVHIMSKRNTFHRTPRFKPEVKVTTSRSDQVLRMGVNKETVEVLTPPIKSQADNKVYR